MLDLAFGLGLQHYTTKRKLKIQIPAPGVLANDPPKPMTASLVSGPSHAKTFNLNTDGSFSYTPANDFSGTDTFQYKGNYGGTELPPTTVTIYVSQGAGQPPVALDDYYLAHPGEAPEPDLGVLSNDSDPDSSTIYTNPPARLMEHWC